MNNYVLITLVTAGTVGVYLLARALFVYAGQRGERLVVCPETNDYEAVRLDAATAARKSLHGRSWVHLEDCTRWHERGRCDEPCIAQIVDAADGCLVRAYVQRFYQDKHCAICRKPIGPIDWTDHMPAAIDSDGRTVAWNTVPARKLPKFLSNHLLVCWDCHIAASFRRDHPALVTDRPRLHH